MPRLVSRVTRTASAYRPHAEPATRANRLSRLAQGIRTADGRLPLQNVVPCQLVERLDLRGHPGLVAAEFMGHQFRHAGSHCNGGLRVQEQSAGAACEYVLHGAGHFKTRGPNDFSAGVRERGMQELCQRRVGLHETAHGWRIGTEHVEMTELARCLVETMDIEMRSSAWTLR